MSPANQSVVAILTPKQAEREAEFFGLLSSDARLRILDLLREQGPTMVSDIARALGISASATSQHLNLLRLGGLVVRTRKAQHLFYRLTDVGREVRLRQAPRRAGVQFR